MSTEDLKKKKKKDEEEEMTAKDLQKQLETANAELEDLRKEKMQRECSELAAYEVSFGRITEEMKEARVKELMEMTPETREVLKTEHAWIIKTLELDKEGMAKKKKKKEEEEPELQKKKKYPYPYPEKKKLDRENRQMLARVRGEDSEVTQGDREMLAFMESRQNQDTIFPGGSK